MSTISNPVERTRYLLARSTTFRTWCGIVAGTEAQQIALALGRAHRYFLQDPSETAFPLCVLGWAAHSARRVAEGGGQFLPSCEVKTTFYSRYAEAAGAETTAAYEFDNTVRAIVVDMAVLSGSADHIRFDDYRRDGDIVVREHKTQLGTEAAVFDLVEVAYVWRADPMFGSQSES